MIFQGSEDGIKDILCAKPVVASDEILKPLFSKHVLVAVSSFPDAIRANRDHLTRAQPGARRDRISSGLVYDCIILECTAEYITLLSIFECFHQARYVNFSLYVDWPGANPQWPGVLDLFSKS